MTRRPGHRGTETSPRCPAAWRTTPSETPPARTRTSSNGSKSRTETRRCSFATASSWSRFPGTTSTHRATSQARPSPSTAQNTSAASSQAAATEGMATPMRAERPLITSGTGSSPARRSSRASRPQSPPTWTQAKTRPTSTARITSFGIGFMCIPGARKSMQATRRTVRAVGTTRPASGIGATRPIGTRPSVSAPSLKS